MPILTQIKEQTTMLGKAIGESIDYDNPAVVSAKLEEQRALQAMASHTVALADKYLKMEEDKAIDDLLGNELYKGLSAAMFKKKVDNSAREAGYYKLLAERQCASISHSIDALRSQLSRLKEEFVQSKYHGNIPNQ